MADSEGSSADSGVTDEELQKEVVKILKNANLQNITTNKVVQKLEKKVGTDLSKRKRFIDQLVIDYGNSLDSAETNEESDSDKEETISVNKEIDEESGTRKTRGRKAEDGAKKTPAKRKKGGVTKRGGKASGYTKAYKLSPELSDLVGARELPRHEVVKRVWAIIKERQLTDPNNRQFAICDKPLYKVIGTPRFYTFGMMKYLKNHFLAN